ncbi:MAG: hypothetical protein JOZ33_11810 [Acidobacteriaceae bacterium]|nr:hypothetical protein [Acidobacteriaceae bacterium]
MANHNSDVPPVLTCWKDIAQYLGKGVRTVQRWEQEFGLPVRRPNGIDHKSPVAAHPTDLDAWLQTRWSARNGGRAQLKPETGSGADDSVHTQLAEAIRISQELRITQRALVSEAQTALEALHANLVTCVNRRREDTNF